MTDAYRNELRFVKLMYPASPVSPPEVYSLFLGVKLYFGGDGSCLNKIKIMQK